MLVPDDKLEDTKLVSERKIDRTDLVVSCGTLTWHGTAHGSLVLPQSFMNRFMQSPTCNMKMTICLALVKGSSQHCL